MYVVEYGRYGAKYVSHFAFYRYNN